MASGTPQYSQAFLDEYIGYRLEATAISFIIITTLFVALRLLAQYLRPVRYGWDDFWTVLSWPFIIVECSVALYVVYNDGIGYHIVAQKLYRPEKIAFWGKWNLYVIPAVYIIGSTLPKFAILALYLRIFVGKFVKWTCWTTVGILAIAMIVNFFTVIFQCNPRAKAWDPTMPGTCNDIIAHFRWSALPNLVTDVIMLIIPIPSTIKLNVPKRTKVAIILTFLLGSLGLVTSLLRMITFFTTTSIPIGDGTSVSDSTWDGNLETIYIIVEPSVYLVSACLLSCRSLFNYMMNESTFVSKTKSFILGLTSSVSTSTRKSHSHGVELSSVENSKSGYTRSGASRRGDTMASTVYVNDDDSGNALKRAESGEISTDTHRPEWGSKERVSPYEHV